MFQKAIYEPFKRALKDAIDAFHLPPDNIFDAGRTASIVVKLKINTANNFKSVHEELQETEGEKEMKWSVVSDTIRQFVYGTYERHVIPVYITHGVADISDPVWKSSGQGCCCCCSQGQS